MGLRSRALVVALFVVCLFGVAPAFAPHAVAQPEIEETEELPVTVAIHDLEPFVMENRSGELTGFSIDLLKEIADRLDWTTEYVTTEDVRGQLEAVADHRADLAIGAISMTAEREQRFDFSQPTIDGGLQIIVPVHNTRPSVPGLGGYLELLFSRTMLIWLSAAVVVSVIPAHLFWLIERRSAEPVVSRSYFPGIVESFGWGIGSLVGGTTTRATKAITRVMAILWAFASIVFVSFYTANLSANLTVAKLDTKITGPADLYEKAVATVADTTAAEYLRNMGIPATETRNIEESYHLLREEGYDAVVYDAPVLRYYVTHRGDGVAVLAGPVFQDEAHGLVFNINSPLRKPVNQTLFRMREDGTYNIIKEKWFGDAISNSAADAN